MLESSPKSNGSKSNFQKNNAVEKYIVNMSSSTFKTSCLTFFYKNKPIQI